MEIDVKRAMAIAMGFVVPVAGGTAALAQDVPLGPPPGFEAPSGIKIGSFDFLGRVQGGFNQTTNVRSDPTEESDQEYILSGAFALRSDWEKHALAATASYYEKQAMDITGQRSEALSYTLSGRFDLSEAFSVSGGFLHNESVIEQNSPQQFSGNLNGVTAEETKEVAFNWNGNPTFASLQLREDEVTNSTDIDTTVLARVQNQDRTERNATLQAGETRSWGKFYGLGGVVEIEYTGSAVILPEDRDSSSVRAGFGIETSSSDMQVIFRLIGFHTDFDAPTIPDIDNVVGTLQVRYALDPRMAVAGKLQRTFDETNIQASGGVFTNTVSAGFQHQVLDDVYYQFGPTFRHYTIAGTSYAADSQALDLIVGYQYHPRVEFLVNAGILFQDVNDPALANLEYEEQHVMLSAVVTF